MEPEYNCKFCGRDVRTVGDSHLVSDEDGHVVCIDCGVAPGEKRPPNPQMESVQAGPKGQQQPQQRPGLFFNGPMGMVDLSSFQKAMPEFLGERIRQILQYGYNPSHDAHHTIGDFACFIRRYLRRLENKVASHDLQEQANARAELIKIGALCIAYVESHPLPNGG